jgi:two-component system, response regulator YesN
MLKKSFPHLKLQEDNQHSSSAKLYLVVTYSIFLLICLALVFFFYVNTTNNARENFWQQQSARLNVAVGDMDDVMNTMDIYTRQLLTDSTFVRFANMSGLDEDGYIYTAYEVMKSLSPRSYLLLNAPISESHIYLQNSGYVISGSQFTEVNQYYNSYKSYTVGNYDAWMALISSAGKEMKIVSTVDYTGLAGSAIFLQDVNTLTSRNIPVIIWFELVPSKVVQTLLPGWDQRVSLYVASEDGTAQFKIENGSFTSFDGATALEAVIPEGLNRVLSSGLSSGSVTSWTDSRLLYQEGSNGWRYTLLVPDVLCTETLGNYDLAFALIFTLAVLGGIVMVIFLVRRNMQPYQQLDTKLRKAEGNNAELQREIDAQKPAVCSAYVRQLLSGHVQSAAEFDYILNFLGLTGQLNFYVLYCMANVQSDSDMDHDASHELLTQGITQYLTADRPVYYYNMSDRSFVVLVAFEQHAETDPLMELQHRVVELHNDLVERYDIWFYAGVGEKCTEAQKLWESYEQARTAARYTAKHHIFLPYEMIHKDAGSWYYPIEISAKLQHFITTGNKQQVTEMFALIHRENIEERSLSMPLLTLLLSDLKNTLLKSRFLITNVQTEEEQEQLSQLDRRLSEQLSFPQLESTALTLCNFFTRTAEPSDPVPEIERYLTENYTDPSMCLAKLSDRFNISESYLSHMFKNKTGQNFSVYLENLRLNEAARRLKEPDCNLSSLYLELGYNNSTTFRRAFKKRFGMAPSEMRS